MVYTQSATITWDDGVNTPIVYTLTAVALNALEAQRLTIVTSPNGPVKYASVVEMIRGALNDYCVIPAIEINRPPDVQTAFDAYVAALAAAITTGQIQE